MRALRALGAIDARWFVFGNNALLLAWGLAFFGLQRSAAQIVTCFATTVGCELLAARLVRGRRGERRRSDLVLSAATAAVSTLVLLVSPEWWFYGLAGAIAILSKYVVRDAASRHVFNPTNFAVVFSVAILSDHLLVRPDQFSGSPWLMVQIVLFGALAITRGARFRTTLGYYAAVLCFALPVGTLLGKKPLWILAPEMNTSTLIFAFLMLTDPRTTPEVPARQWAFGVGVAVVHLCLRYFQVPYSPFIALFVVAGVRSAWARPLTLVAAPRQFPKMQLKWLLVVSVPVFAPACFSSNNAQPGPDAGSVKFDAGQPAADATVPDASAPEAAPDTYVAEGSLPEAAVDAGPQLVTVVVHTLLGPEQGVKVVFQDAAGAVLTTATTDALGNASALVPSGSQATALMGTAVSPMLMTIQGIAPGDVLAVYDPSHDGTTAPVSIDLAPDAAPPPGSASFIAHIGSCGYGFSTFPATFNLNPSYDCQAQGAFSVLINAQAGSDGGYADLGYTYQRANTLPSDGGVANVTMTGGWTTTTGTQTLVPANAPLSGMTMGLGEVVNNVSTPDDYMFFSDDAGGSYVFKTYPGFADSLQGEATLYHPSFLLNSTYALAMSGVATKRLGDAGTTTFDLNQNFPLLDQASIDASSPAQPAVAWGSEAGALTPADGVFVQVQWGDVDDAGATIRGIWTIITPPTSSSITAPALPPGSAWAPSPSAMFSRVPIVVVVDADFVADYAQLRAQAGSLPISSNVRNGRSTAAAPPLPADGTLKLTAITVSGD